MHRALLLPDIFLSILDYVVVLPVDGFYLGYNTIVYHGNPSVARLARTCRAFLEPCLDALWRHQYTLAPLVKTLPEDAIKETVHKATWKSGNHRFFKLSITRPLARIDWLRFDYYASRVRSLGYLDVEYADLEGISWAHPGLTHREREVLPELVALLCLYRGSRWILPNLVNLRWNVYDVHYTDHLPMFLGPHMQTLAVALEARENPHKSNERGAIALRQITQYCQVLADLCPHLRELEMYPKYASDVVMAAQHFATRCRRLEGFHVDTCRHVAHDQDSLISLATKPHLRKVFLWVDAESAEYIPLLSSAPVLHPFPSLQILYLQGTRLGFCTPLFDAMEHCRLFSLTVEVHLQPLAADVTDFFEALRKHCAKYTLHVLRVVQRCLDMLTTEDDEWPPTKSAHWIDIELLSILFYFSNMRTFHFTLPLFPWLTDDDLRLIGDAWPGLVAFSFIDCWGAPIVMPATWEGVAGLLKRCPMLCGISLVFDTTRNLDAVYAPDVRPHSRLRVFDMINSVLPDDPAVIARALIELAPRVLRVGAKGPLNWDVDPDSFIPFDSVAYCAQVYKISCQLRAERFGDEYRLDERGKTEIDSAVDSVPSEWNPWG
ncbi:hypothetical protein C8Q77DRAFT_1068064 [Trametes polyzona]|nr:hypothetical protein C8Q77DRAFT_1068064 [Trametes polyzona]